MILMTLQLSTFMALATPSAQKPPPRHVSMFAEVGVQALGFQPLPANPNFSIGAETLVVTRPIYGLHVGGSAGGFWQVHFLRGAHLEASLSNRWTAPFGLYGAIDFSLGAQLGVVPGTNYRAEKSGPPTAARSNVHAGARLGLGAELGVDLSRITRVPLRVFMHYRQLAITPFMPGNDLPAMGLSVWTGGVAYRFGGRR